MYSWKIIHGKNNRVCDKHGLSFSKLELTLIKFITLHAICRAAPRPDYVVVAVLVIPSVHIVLNVLIDLKLFNPLPFGSLKPWFIISFSSSQIESALSLGNLTLDISVHEVVDPDDCDPNR